MIPSTVSHEVRSPRGERSQRRSAVTGAACHGVPPGVLWIFHQNDPRHVVSTWLAEPKWPKKNSSQMAGFLSPFHSQPGPCWMQNDQPLMSPFGGVRTPWLRVGSPGVTLRSCRFSGKTQRIPRFSYVFIHFWVVSQVFQWYFWATFWLLNLLQSFLAQLVMLDSHCATSACQELRLTGTTEQLEALGLPYFGAFRDTPRWLSEKWRFSITRG